jgi:hypothetical protein
MGVHFLQKSLNDPYALDEVYSLVTCQKQLYEEANITLDLANFPRAFHQ